MKIILCEAVMKIDNLNSIPLSVFNYYFILKANKDLTQWCLAKKNNLFPRRHVPMSGDILGL